MHSANRFPPFPPKAERGRNLHLSVSIGVERKAENHLAATPPPSTHSHFLSTNIALRVAVRTVLPDVLVLFRGRSLLYDVCHDRNRCLVVGRVQPTF